MDEQVTTIAAGVAAFTAALGAALMRLGYLPVSGKKVETEKCPDPSCKAGAVRLEEKVENLDRMVTGFSARLERVAEDVAFIRGRLED